MCTQVAENNNTKDKTHVINMQGLAPLVQEGNHAVQQDSLSDLIEELHVLAVFVHEGLCIDYKAACQWNEDELQGYLEEWVSLEVDRDGSEEDPPHDELYGVYQVQLLAVVKAFYHRAESVLERLLSETLEVVRVEHWDEDGEEYEDVGEGP